MVDHFDGLLTGFVLDEVDADFRDRVDIPTLVTNTLMTDLASKTQLAQGVLLIRRRTDNTYCCQSAPSPFTRRLVEILMKLWLLVPVKPFDEGKSRLAGVLPSDRRVRR